MRYISCNSGGKDSMAQTIVAIERGEPLDENLWCEVMFTNEISAEVPEHRDFMYEVAIPKLERDYGVKTKVIRAEKTMVDLFYHVCTKGKSVGKLLGFPIPGKCMINRELKLKPMHDYINSIHEEVTQYVGIAIDEPERLARLKPGRASILAKHGITEAMAKEISIEHGLYSPIYQFAKRNGCFFCPNVNERQLRHLYDNHRDLWDMLLHLQGTPNLTYPKWARGVSLFDYDRLFKGR